MAEKKIILVDGNALVHRAYHALPPLSTSKGEPTNAVFGFTSMLLRALADIQPEYIAVAFDVGRTFRHEEYEDYKANRPKMSEDLASQFARVKEVISAFNIPIFEVEGYEADDVLGTLAKQASDKGLETIILTGDTDTFQLIGHSVKVLTSRRRFSDTVIYDEERIRRRYGLTPGQLVDLKALKGDPSDNIPGVRGIGDKRATRLLKEFSSIEEIYAHFDEIKSGRIRKALADKEDQALFNKRLVTIVTDVAVDFDLSACRFSDYDRDRVMALFRELEFSSLVDRLPEKQERARQMAMFDLQEAKDRERGRGNYGIITTEEELRELVAKLQQVPAFAFDVEATDTDAMLASLVGIAIALQPGEAYYIPVDHVAGPQLPLDHVLEKIKPILEDASIAKYAHNAKYDLTILARYGVEVKALAFDTMVAAYLLDPSGRMLNLKKLAWSKLAVEITPITDLIGKGKKQISMAQVPIPTVAQYACADADMTHRLVRLLDSELREKEFWDLFSEVEMPLIIVLIDMEMTGVPLDVDFMKEMSRDLYQQITALEDEIYKAAGHEFNINSTQQLGGVLFDELGLPVIRRTKTGYSTAADVLEELRAAHPIIELILEYRQLTKLKSTYIDSLPLLVNPRTGRVHTSYNQTGTVTGRISSSNPNLQNIPIRAKLGRKVRRAFVAGEGDMLLSADYSQVELRILAHISQDEGLLAAFHRGEDIHASTAATIFDVPIEEVTPAMRRVAKTINFGVTYGMSGYGLAQRTDLSQEEANQFIANYFARYPGVKAYVEETKQKAKDMGYVSTLLGRRRYFPELQRPKVSGALRHACEREAINMPIQGTAADILKLAMIRLHKAIRERDLGSRMILQVHDELVLEVPENEVKGVGPLVKSIMEGAFELDAPLKVDEKVGPNWLEMTNTHSVYS